jgi:hypothetical protein
MSKKNKVKPTVKQKAAFKNLVESGGNKLI